MVVARAQVGNIYVNRNVIGAVVGVQPFGGEGLSGTGPKAVVRSTPSPGACRADAVAGHEPGGCRRGRPWTDEFSRWLGDGSGRALLGDG